jgi:hypothetical protein
MVLMGWTAAFGWICLELIGLYISGMLPLSKRRLEEGVWLTVDMRAWFLRTSGIDGAAQKLKGPHLSKQLNRVGYEETCSLSRDFLRCRGTDFDSD